MKKDSLNDTELRSLGVQNLLDKHPHWLILKGNFLISIILLFFLLIVSYSVKYPEFVKSKITITSQYFQDSSNDKVVIGQLTVSQNDLMKVRKGQKVIVRLYDFPYQEYGVLNTQVQEISTNIQGSHINIIFPKDLKTSYNKNILVNKELKGNAEIIVQDTRLIEKIFYQIK